MEFHNLHTHKFTGHPNTLELVNQYPWEFNDGIPFYSIGIHPWYINEERIETDLKVIEEKLQLKECLALGECGLDKRIEIPMPLQKMVFEKQIALAGKYQKPLVLHLVAAYDELLEINKRLQITVPVILHGFSKNEQLAKQMLDAGFYLSFGKYLLRNPDLKQTFQSMPNDRFFLETDTIEETLLQVYHLAAAYKDMTLVGLQTQIGKNWQDVFKVAP